MQLMSPSHPFSIRRHQSNKTRLVSFKNIHVYFALCSHPQFGKNLYNFNFYFPLDKLLSSSGIGAGSERKSRNLLQPNSTANKTKSTYWNICRINKDFLENVQPKQKCGIFGDSPNLDGKTFTHIENIKYFVGSSTHAYNNFHWDMILMESASDVNLC